MGRHMRATIGLKGKSYGFTQFSNSVAVMLVYEMCKCGSLPVRSESQPNKRRFISDEIIIVQFYDCTTNVPECIPRSQFSRAPPKRNHLSLVQLLYDALRHQWPSGYTANHIQTRDVNATQKSKENTAKRKTTWLLQVQGGGGENRHAKRCLERCYCSANCLC